MVLASAALTACSGAQPEQKTVPVTVQLPAQPEKAPDLTGETETPRKPKTPEPIMKITDQMRWRLHNMNECGHKNWEKCGKEVTDLFWELTKKIPKSEDRKCREDGDYAEGCVEKVYEQYVGNDQLLQEYSSKKKACQEDYHQCTVTAEANCDQKCWRDIKELLEKEQQNRNDQSQDWTMPKNP